MKPISTSFTCVKHDLQFSEYDTRLPDIMNITCILNNYAQTHRKTQDNGTSQRAALMQIF